MDLSYGTEYEEFRAEVRQFLKVNWPPGLLQMKASDPLAQPGVTVHSDPEGAEMLITFAGKFTGHFALQDRR